MEEKAERNEEFREDTEGEVEDTEVNWEENGGGGGGGDG